MEKVYYIIIAVVELKCLLFYLYVEKNTMYFHIRAYMPPYGKRPTYHILHTYILAI
jgi:hypothetical protein